MRWVVVVAAILVAAQAVGGCFFYDSRWGQAEEEQRRAAKRQAAVKLRPSGSDNAQTGAAGGVLARRPASELRTLTLRAYATPEYVAETVRWQGTLNESVEATNGVLSELGVRLTLERASLWRPKAGSGTLETTIGELRSFDAGADVDFVVGLVGSLPRVEFSFHQLGMAGLLGKHLVVRAMNDAAEFAAIQQYMDELDEGERQKLYQSRKRHKNASVLLHELGHALGALHVQNPKDLMHPRYSAEASSFGPETRALVAITLRRPNYATDGKQQQIVIEESLEQLKTRQSAAWVVGERESRIDTLQKMLARKTQRNAAPARGSASGAMSQPLPMMSLTPGVPDSFR